MAYGSTKSISDSILSATDGESIQEQIDVYMQSTASGTTGDGLIAAATINKNTDAAVTAMRRKSLGARKSQATAQETVRRDKLASVGRDWTALLMGVEEEDAPINATLRSDMMAKEASSAPQTANEAYLQRRELPTDGDRPDVFTPDGSDNISGSGASEAEGRFDDEPAKTGLDEYLGANNVDAIEAFKAETAASSLMSRPPQARPENSIFFGTESTKIKFGQTALKDLGFYGNRVDGDAGMQTRNAIKTFQYKNNLPVTGVFDDDTKVKLSSTSGLVRQPKPQTTLLSFISKGEGGYGAVNNDNSAGNVPKANQKMMIDGYYSDTYNKPLTDMTVNEIMNAQVGTTGKTTEELLKMNPESVASQKKREFFAVGAYQIVPVTMWKAAKQGAIDANDIFSPKVQDKISMDFLAGSDRLKLQAFLAGDPNVSVDEAALDLAKQFASAPVTKTQSVSIKIKKKDGSFGTGTKKVVAGTSYYDKVGNNSAQHTAAETKAMLLQARDENTL
mgnify:CR=1 FL=1